MSGEKGEYSRKILCPSGGCILQRMGTYGIITAERLLYRDFGTVAPALAGGPADDAICHERLRLCGIKVSENKKRGCVP